MGLYISYNRIIAKISIDFTLDQHSIALWRAKIPCPDSKDLKGSGCDSVQRYGMRLPSYVSSRPQRPQSLAKLQNFGRLFQKYDASIVLLEHFP